MKERADIKSSRKKRAERLRPPERKRTGLCARHENEGRKQEDKSLLLEETKDEGERGAKHGYMSAVLGRN